jgi:cytochrome d ubiquinol oxidase subunit I
MWTGDGSAVKVAKVQPMKLAAMEGLYDGSCGQSLVGFGIVNPNKERTDNQPAILGEIAIPYGLSILANHDMNSFVPGINDLINGVSINAAGDTVSTVSYAERIERGRAAQQALRNYDAALAVGDDAALAAANEALKADFKYFGYGYLDSVDDAVPPVALTFYAFRIMVMGGGYLLLFFLAALFMSLRKPKLLEHRLIHVLGLLTIPVVWLVSEAGWVTAEIGRQPWTIEGLLPTRAAVSAISAGSVQVTFFMFVVVFVGLLVAEVSIMLREISKATSKNLLHD